MNRKIISIFILLVFTMFLSSCTPRKVEIPTFIDKDLSELLNILSNVEAVEAVISMQYERGDNLMRGDAALSISENHVDLRVYYLGFLAGYLKEDRGVITASQNIDRLKKAMLIDGLKQSFLWWKIEDYTIIANNDIYILKNFNRKIMIDKRTLLPIEQTIELYNGDVLKITYSSPVKIEQEFSDNTKDSSLGSWYQSNMMIELNNHLLKIKITSYSLLTYSSI